MAFDPSAAADRPRPVLPGERETMLDILRGIGVLGILMVNIQVFAMPSLSYQNPFAAPFPMEGIGADIWFTTHVFFEFKFITLFSFLFGASLYLVGGAFTDGARSAVLRRRLWWLMAFGLIHGLVLWYGDILFAYAVCGLAVYYARSWKPSSLIVLGVILTVIGGLITPGIYGFLSFAPPEVIADVEAQAWSPGSDLIGREIAAMQGGILENLGMNAEYWVTYQIFGVALMAFWRTAGIMMIGLALYKLGFLTGRAPLWVYGLAVLGGAAALTGIWMQADANLAAGYPFMPTAVTGLLVNYFLSPFATLGYIGAAVLLYRMGVLSILGTALAAVGRMAFTNYIAQTLIMTTIFWGGRGLGLFGEVDRDGQLMLVLGVWAAQLVWSPIWLALFRYGPLEWLWRGLSYRRFPAFTGRDAEAAPAR